MLLVTAKSFDLFSVNPGLILWTLVTFIVVLVILWLFAWNPILKALDTRNSKIEDDLTKSKQLREKAEQLLAEYEHKIEKASLESLSFMEDVKKNAEIERQRIIAETKKESDSIVAKANVEIHQAKLKTLEELESSILSITTQILSRILQNDVNTTEHAKIIVRELELIKKESN